MAKTARDIMDPDTPTVGPEAPVDEVVRIMAQGDEDVVLVINEGHRCIGIITESDSPRHFLEVRAEGRLRFLQR